MKIIRSLFDFYIQSSIHVALSAVALTWLTFISFDINIDWQLLGFVFSATVTGYNFVLYAGIAKWHHRTLPPNLRLIQLFSLIAFLVMLLFLWLLPAQFWWWVLVTAVLTLFYAVPALPGGKNLRNVPGLKIGVIVLVWTIVTVVFPLANSMVVLGQAGMILLLQRFLFVLVLILPFEIRDLNVDSISLGTLPQRFGVFKTKLLGTVLLLIVLLTELYLNSHYNHSLIAVLIIVLLTGVALWFANKSRSFYYTAFWVEAIPIVWLLLEAAL